MCSAEISIKSRNGGIGGAGSKWIGNREESRMGGATGICHEVEGGKLQRAVSKYGKCAIVAFRDFYTPCTSSRCRYGNEQSTRQRHRRNPCVCFLHDTTVWPGECQSTCSIDGKCDARHCWVEGEFCRSVEWSSVCSLGQ